MKKEFPLKSFNMQKYLNDSQKKNIKILSERRRDGEKARNER
jgi:hypothetical protein